MTIKGIFFDAADVLYRRPEPTRKLVSSLLVERGFSPEIPSQERKRHQMLRSQAKRGQVSPEEYWEQRLMMHDVAVPYDRKTLVGMILDYSDEVLPIPGGRQALKTLKQRGYILGIVTDSMHSIERKKRWLDRVDVGDLIDVLVCSSVLGVHKPDAAIYLEALSRANLTPDVSAFVGHAADELWGARQVGLTTIAVYQDSDAKADFYASSLLDLLNVPVFQGLDSQRAET